MNQIAVISGDLVNSSIMTSEALQKTLQILRDELDSLQNIVGIYSIYRGDSFQCLVKNPEHAFATCLLLKASINAYQEKITKSKNTEPIADVRLSIGIGEAQIHADGLETSNGEAFQYSGRTLDTMKNKGVKMALTTGNSEINENFTVYFKLLDALTDRWSVASAEVVYHLLKGHKEQQIANLLDRSQAAINHRKKAANWEEIKMLLQHYELIINRYFK